MWELSKADSGVGTALMQPCKVSVYDDDSTGGQDTAVTMFRNLLPVQPNRLIGRDHDIAAVCELLLRPDHRLVTLLGTGGIGKTRMVISAAEAVADSFDDGVSFIDLSETQDANTVPTILLAELGLSVEGGSRVERLEGFLHDRQMLLVMDNFEYVIPAASVVDKLLGSCPRVKILVTSREPLHLRWERRVFVDPLAILDLQGHVSEAELLQNPAVQLFIERARAVNVRFATTEATLSDIAAICVELEGLPLAIELAAARTAVFSPSAILQRLTMTGSMLHRQAPDTPLRHQSIQNALASSYDGIPDATKTVFRHMGVFMGGVSLDALEAVLRVCGITTNVIDPLSTLVDMSLVRFAPTPDGEPRYKLLEPVRQYAIEQLQAASELDPAAEAHARYYTSFVECESKGLRSGGFFVFLPEDGSGDGSTPRTTRWSEMLSRELPNIRIALSWAQTHRESAMLLQTAGLLARFWWLRGLLQEAAHWLEIALAGSPDATPELLSRALGGLGIVKRQQGRYMEAVELLEHAVKLASTANDTSLLTSELIDYAATVAWQRKIARATELLQQQRETAQANGDTWGLAVVELHLGVNVLMHRDGKRAEAHLARSLTLFHEVEDLRGISVANVTLALAIALQKNLTRAEPYIRPALEAGRRAGQQTLLPALLDTTADVLARGAEPQTAAHLLGAADELRARGYARATIEQDFYDASLAILRRKMSAEELVTALGDGRGMSAEQVIDEALAVVRDVPLPVEPESAEEITHDASAFSRREQQVLKVLAEGVSNREIGRRLGISENTVKFHITSIFSKLGAKSRIEAISIAIKRELV